MATVAFLAGDVVAEEDPWLFFLSDSALGLFCSWCMRRIPAKSSCITEGNPSATSASRRGKCGGCGIVGYCSASCQKMDWKAYHKEECVVLQELNKHFNEKISKSLAKLEPPKNLKEGQVVRRMFTLEKDPLDVGPGRIMVLVRVWKKLYSVLDEDCSGSLQPDQTVLSKLERSNPVPSGVLDWMEGCRLPDAATLGRLFDKLYSNSLPVLTGDGHLEVGRAVYPSLLAVTQSCRFVTKAPQLLSSDLALSSPNVVQFFKGKTVSVVAVENISSLTDVKMSYTRELSVPASHRQAFASQLSIWCSCERCLQPNTDNEGMFALKCVNRACDARIPFDERANGRCGSCRTRQTSRRCANRLRLAQALCAEAVSLVIRLRSGGSEDSNLRFYSECLRDYEEVLHPTNVVLGQYYALAPGLMLANQYCERGVQIMRQWLPAGHPHLLEWLRRLLRFFSSVDRHEAAAALTAEIREFPSAFGGEGPPQ